MSNSNPNQLDFFTLSFNKDFPSALRPLAFKILDKLYIDKDGINMKEAYLLFNNCKIEMVRETLRKLSNDYYLIVLDKSRCEGTEKRYFITEFGRKVLLEHFNRK